MQAATIYRRGEKILVHSSSKTTAGLWVLNAPVLSVSEDIGEFGRAVAACLAASRQGVPPPKSFVGLFDPVLALAGVKSFNTFVKSARCVEVEMTGETVTFVPTRNEGADEGFVPLEKNSQVSGASDDALGAAALAALAVAE